MNILEQLKKAKETAPKERSESVKVDTGTSSSSPKEYQDPYFSSKILSNSGVKSFNKDGTKKEGFAPAYRFGNLSDAYMTEPHLYNHELMETMSPTQWEQVQIWKQWEALKASSEARALLGNDYFEYIDFCHKIKGDGFDANKYKGHYKGSDFELQRVQYGTYDWNGYKVPMRGKYDVYRNKTIIDLKTSTQQTRQECIRSMKNLGYWTQPNIYGPNGLCKSAVDFVFVFITYCSWSMVQKAMLGNVKMKAAVNSPSQVHIVKASQMPQQMIEGQRMIHDQLTIVEKFQPHLLK